MSIGRVPPAAPVPAPSPVARPAATTPDLVTRFAAALGQRQAPLPVRKAMATPSMPAPTTPAAPAPRTAKRAEDMADAPSFGLLPQPGAAPPTQAPLAATVDPAAFADVLNQMWLREQNRTVREVTVSLGEEAWPATAVRLLRLPDGSLSIAVTVDRHGRTGDVDALRRQLADRGLSVSELELTNDDGPNRKD